MITTRRNCYLRKWKPTKKIANAINSLFSSHVPLLFQINIQQTKWMWLSSFPPWLLLHLLSSILLLLSPTTTLHPISRRWVFHTTFSTISPVSFFSAKWFEFYCRFKNARGKTGRIAFLLRIPLRSTNPRRWIGARMENHRRLRNGRSRSRIPCRVPMGRCRVTGAVLMHGRRSPSFLWTTTMASINKLITPWRVLMAFSNL